MAPNPIGSQQPPPKVKLSWCHNGTPKTKVFTRGENDPNETTEAFIDRVGDEAKAALIAETPTGDCDPAFPA